MAPNCTPAVISLRNCHMAAPSAPTHPRGGAFGCLGAVLLVVGLLCTGAAGVWLFASAAQRTRSVTPTRSSVVPDRRSIPTLSTHSGRRQPLATGVAPLAANAELLPEGPGSAPWGLLLAALGLTASALAAAAIARAVRTDGYVLADHVTDSRTSEARRELADAIFQVDRRPVILFDGVCNLCNTGVNFVLDWDSDGRFRFAALQSPEGRALLERSGRSPDDISSIVLVTPGDGGFTKSDAVLRIGQGLGSGPWAAMASAGWLFPRPLRDFVYDRVASNRYNLFGRTDACRLSTDGFADRFVALADAPSPAPVV